MKTKIKNWFERHNTIYGAGMLCVSLAMVAFGGAYLGANTALSKFTVDVNLCPMDEVAEMLTE